MTSCRSLSSVERKPDDVRTPSGFRSRWEGRGFKMSGDLALPHSREPAHPGR